jgi:SAM-dependent methyltransferase
MCLSFRQPGKEGAAVWTPNPFYYEFGRPFPAALVQRLFVGCTQMAAEFGGRPVTRVYEPGAGTGRVLIPLAQLFPEWHFTGVDQSREMIEAARCKMVANNITNISLIHQNVLEHAGEQPSDLIVVSSLLHALRDWRRLLEALVLRELTPRGGICLIGERGDLYDCALGRRVEHADARLVDFWATYRECRKLIVKDDLEASQVGVRWEMDSVEAEQLLLSQGFFEMDTNEVEWTHSFRVSDMVRIVEERCYSSMFSVPPKAYAEIVASIKARLRDPDETVTSRHLAKVRCFTRM